MEERRTEVGDHVRVAVLDVQRAAVGIFGAGPLVHVEERVPGGELGFVVVGMFVVTWAIALLVWRYGRIEERWTPAEN